MQTSSGSTTYAVFPTILDGTLAHASATGITKLLSNKTRQRSKAKPDDFQALTAVLNIAAGASSAAGVVCGAAAAVPEDAPAVSHAPLLDTHSEDELDWDMGQAYADVHRVSDDEEGGGAGDRDGDDDDDVVEVSFHGGTW